MILLALLAGLAAAILGGTVGTFVVVRRISFISGSISHSILAGIGLCLLLERTYHLPGLSPLLGALVTAILSALIIAKVEQTHRERSDSIIATIWAAGMAIGIILIAKTPGYTAELSNVLIGNILWVTPGDVITLFGLALLSLLFVTLNFQKLKLLSFDGDEAALQGIKTERLYRQLLILVAMSVVALTQVVGIVLVMTMLTLPPLLASLYCKRLSSTIIGAIGVSILCTILGLIAAATFDWPAGASIAVISVVLFLLGVVWMQTRQRKHVVTDKLLLQK